MLPFHQFLKVPVSQGCLSSLVLCRLWLMQTLHRAYTLSFLLRLHALSLLPPWIKGNAYRIMWLLFVFRLSLWLFYEAIHFIKFFFYFFCKFYASRLYFIQSLLLLTFQ